MKSSSGENWAEIQEMENTWEGSGKSLQHALRQEIEFDNSGQVIMLSL